MTILGGNSPLHLLVSPDRPLTPDGPLRPVLVDPRSSEALAARGWQHVGHEQERTTRTPLTGVPRTDPVIGTFDRASGLERLTGQTFDVLVIGGGITGAGVLLDAVSRGLSAALIEKHDFASGTSSKSSKLVHGGLRYLQHGEIGLVREALAERTILMGMAPHLVRVMPFMIPMFSRDGVINPRISRALGLALWQYDLAGGLRIGRAHRRLDHSATLAMVPALRGERVGASYLYFDAQADDARLTLEVIRTAALDFGAVAVNHCRPVSLLHDPSGLVAGAEVMADDGRFTVRARTVVNATGVWADDIGELDAGTRSRTVRPAKGVHVTVPRERLPTEVAVVVPVRGDRRSVFVVPWGDFVYVGTTDTDYRGPLEDPTCDDDDVSYLLDAVNAATTADLTPTDVTGTWAGLRPLVDRGDAGNSRTADLSRRHLVDVSPSGMVTVTGGKLTTFRRMAADAVDRCVEQLPASVAGRSRTRRLRLIGARGHGDHALTGLPPGAADHLRRRYGGQARTIAAIVSADPGLGAPLVEGLPYLRAEAAFGFRHEMAVTTDDILARRTRARLLDAEAAARAEEGVADLARKLVGQGPFSPSAD